MKYTDSHEWIRLEGEDIAVVGITSYAKGELGDIVYIEFPKVDHDVKARDEVVVLESTKAAADIYAPISGKIIEINANLKEDLDLLNQSPENEGWLFKMRIANMDELNKLLEKNEYLELVKS